MNGYKQVFWGGTTTLELAKAIEFAVEKELSGVWNLTNGNRITKLEMLRMFNSFLAPNKRKKIYATTSKSSDKSLQSERSDIEYTVPSYDEMFKVMIDDILMNRVDYSHYDSF